MTGRTLLFLGMCMLLVVGLSAFPVLVQTGWLSTHIGSSVWCALIWLIGYSAVILGDARGLWSPTAVYFVIFAFFHFGLAVMVILGGSTDGIDWFLDPEVPQAFALVGLGGIGLALGSVLPAILHAASRVRYRETTTDGDPSVGTAHNPQDILFGQLMAQIGSGIAIGCILGWILMILIATRGSPYSLSYVEFLLATEGYPRPWLTFGIALGVSLVAINLEHRVSRIAIGMFVFWALIVLPIGIRSDVMFPAAGALVAQGWKLRHIPRRYFIGGALVLLCFTSLLREMRVDGISRFEWRWDAISPASALKELGQSLRPTYETIRWVQDGDELIGGVSFWAPFERGFLRIFPVQERPAFDEERQLTVLVENRVGPIGFSPVAEAYYNFGTIGVPIVLGVIGLIVGLLSLVGSSLLGRALMLMTLVPLMLFIRNSFTQVPGQLVAGWGLALTLWILAALIAKRLSKSVEMTSIGGEATHAGTSPRSLDQNRPI